MKMDCNIIKDLLPLYVEGLLSKESVSLVEEHLKECTDCTDALKALKNQNSEDVIAMQEQTGYLDQAAPLKKVKKRFRKRGLLIGLLSVVATVAVIFGYIMLKPVSVDYGASELYSRTEIDQAVVAVKLDFAKMVGCKLFSLSFAGDERCQKELEDANFGRISGDQYTDCIVLNSVFRSPFRGGPVWEANELYYWSWILVRKDNGSWIIYSKGYA